MRPILYALLMTAPSAGLSAQQTPRPRLPPAPGVTRELAAHRAATLSDVAYNITLRVPDSLDAPIRGVLTARFRLSDGGPVVLDFKQPAERVLAVEAGGEPVRASVRNGHIVVSPAALRRGVNELRIEFLAGDGSLNRNADYLYALFVPDRASVALPLFDQPDVKARFTLELDVPRTWVAVSNGEERRVERVDRAVYRFAATEPIPPYLFAFAAGRWSVESAEIGGRTFRMFHRESDAAKLARNRDAIFSLQADALAWMEEYTGIRYPFGKFDFVLVPAFQFGGMEHPGAVYYRDASLLLDETATQSQRLGRASLIAHETAHMWFGDLVTMEWFDDVWTKEVFANFMAAKIVNPAFPEVDHDLRFFLSHHPAAYEIDRSAGANPIRQELDNLLDAGSLYGAIIYDKAPIVMEHLERIMGEAAFRNGLRAYLGEFAHGNATWPELIGILDRRSPADLAAWSRVWVEEPGRPTIRATLVRADDGARTIRVEQHDPAGLGRVWPQRLGLRIGAGDSVRALELDLAGPSATVAVPPTWPEIEWLLPNGDGVAYGWFRLDPPTRAALLAGLETLPEPLLRGVAWVTLWDALLAGDVAPAALIDLAIRAVPVESAELNVQRMLGDAGTAFWRFLDEAERGRVAPRLEAVLWDGVLHAPTATLQAAYFQAFERLALTDAAVRRLDRLWSGELEVEGLELSERDRTRLAFALAVRGVPEAARILGAQAAAIENPDRRRRFEFIRPALSADSAARAAFFAGLADPENRAHEAWVVDAVGWLHHPLRAASAVPFILPALELVEEIQRTGDIFFPKRWLDATLGGHATPEAAAIVRAFLAARPDYPSKLREKILQSADELFRAAAMRAP